jgi:glycine cleavage system H protein
MGEVLNDLKYTNSHEWIRLESDTVGLVGISDYAQHSLGDIVYVELPEVGLEIDAGAEVAVVESVKSASDIYSPVTGKVIEINSTLTDKPETVNESPNQDGWLFKVELGRPEELDDLMQAKDYQDFIGEM